MGLRDENLRGVIDGRCEFLNTWLFTGLNLDVKDYEKFDEFLDLKKILKQKIENGKFEDGKEEIFKKLESIGKNKIRLDPGILRVAFWFYNEVNKLSDEALKCGGFTRLDVLEGMQKIEDMLING